MSEPWWVPSSDGVQVAVHELGGEGPPLVCSHATGFHGRCWEPVVAHLSDHFHCFALDYRGHGMTIAPYDWQVDWERYGDDAVAVAEAVSTRAGGARLVAVGHSMGGACLLMAAHRRPELFAGLVLYEPIVFPTDAPSPHGDGPSPLVEGARRRRSSFPSLEAALANYASKPPLNAFTPAALAAYVEHGFLAGDDGQVHLRCAPEHEARTFESGGRHRTWDVLGEIEVPAVVVAGRVTEAGPAALAAAIAGRLPRGRYVELPELDHFGPMTHPERVADLVVQSAAEWAGEPLR